MVRDVGLAKAQGVPGEMVEKSADVATAIKRGMASGGPYLVDVRIDGSLRDLMKPPAGMHAAIVSRIKVIGKMDIAEKRLPQEGRVHIIAEGREIDLRVSSMPTWRPMGPSPGWRTAGLSCGPAPSHRRSPS